MFHKQNKIATRIPIKINSYSKHIDKDNNNADNTNNQTVLLVIYLRQEAALAVFHTFGDVRGRVTRHPSTGCPKVSLLHAKLAQLFSLTNLSTANPLPLFEARSLCLPQPSGAGNCGLEASFWMSRPFKTFMDSEITSGKSASLKMVTCQRYRHRIRNTFDSPRLVMSWSGASHNPKPQTPNRVILHVACVWC